MRSLATILALVVATLVHTDAYSQASESQGLESFSGMSRITWDSHVHPGNSSMFAIVADPAFDPSGPPPHSHRWCEDAYQEGKLRGLKAVVLSHHAFHLESPAGLAAWIANAGGYTDPLGAFWPTHVDGYPLLVSGGHTTDEVDALWECAEASTIPGEFLAFYGIEYTPGSSDAPGCDVPGAARCGGHKVGIFGTVPEISCANYPRAGADPAQTCPEEGDFYDALDLYSDASHLSVASAAHATGIGSLFSEWEPYADPGAPGGMSPAHIQGYGFRKYREDVPCVAHSDPPVSPATGECGYRQVLAYGWHLAPWLESDSHLKGDRWDTWIVGSQARGICLASEFTKSSFLDAVEQRRCYWTQFGVNEPLIQFELEGVQMGQRAGPRGDLDYSIYMDGHGEFPGRIWEIGCGETTRDGSNGNYSAQASGSCDDAICEASGSFPAGSLDWCYLRVKVNAGSAGAIAVTAPVILDVGLSVPAMVSRWGLAALAVLLAAVGILSRARCSG